LEGDDFERLFQQQESRNNLDTSSTTYSGWKKIYWDSPFDKGKEASPSMLQSISSPLPPSPVEQRTIGGRSIWIKRDDLLKLPNSGISGNKARKMWTLDQLPPGEEFPSCIVSHGGPQSNSMLALAAVVHSKNRMITNGNQDNNSTKQFRFVYCTKTLPRFLRNQPNGNLFRALSLGMELIELTPQDYSNLFEEHHQLEGDPPMGLAPPVPGDSVWVPQGGACGVAQAGTFRLAQEIFDVWQKRGQGRTLTVCVPGGTCTTAVVLYHGLKRLALECEENSNDDDATEVMDIEVVVIPCVGDETYARRQMMSLSVQIGQDAEDIPTILSPSPDEQSSQKYFVFGKPDKEILETFQELQQQNLVVDLLYGAPSFAILLRHLRNDNTILSSDVLFDPFHPLSGRELMYVHSGGLEGINSQLLRYKYEGMVEIEDVQLPGKASKK
jgi:1-aminocyclopropane-1-carboxylate deaminase/D-cysteine desulfhydrase-like pyridoxal-dependent ACC family enzyme